MTARHARPPRIVPVAVADGMLLCAAGLAIVATQVAPHPVAAETFTTAPEASEPIARGGLLAVPSIGFVAESPSEVLDQVLQRAPGQPVQTTTHSRSAVTTRHAIATESQWTTPPRQQPSQPTTETPTQSATVPPSQTDSQPASTGTSGTATDPTTQPSESSPTTSSDTPSEQPTSSGPSLICTVLECGLTESPASADTATSTGPAEPQN